MLKKKMARLAVFVVPLLLIFSQCINFKNEDPRGKEYAGSAACVSCHKKIYGSYLHTAHFMASQPASAETIQGSFDKDKNAFEFSPSLRVVMNKRDTGFFQTSYVNGKAEQSQRFDISFGGIKGQTYAYWFTNELFQLPISYVTNSHTWINSPGYEPNYAAFNRPVGMQCLNCHVSFVKGSVPELPGYYSNNEGFERKSLVYGVDCERCHGAAAEHVKFHIDNPQQKKSKYITAVSSLTRAQKITMCAICHSGADNHMLKAAFTYKPTDTLAKFIRLFSSNAPVNYKIIDVHGNQTGLLESSKCFTSSSMTCNTCHNTHMNERDKVLLYANRCLTCHNTSTIHKSSAQISQMNSIALINNCVSCHMPQLSSKLIIAGQSGALVHTHHIAVYPDQTEQVILALRRVIAKTTPSR